MKTRTSVALALSVLILALMLSACDVSRVTQGTVRDTLFSVEENKSGTWGLFLTHDESVVYCTTEQELADEAMSLLLEHDGEVIIEFKGKKWFEDTEGEFLGWDECEAYIDSDGGFTAVILTDIFPVEGIR